MDQVINENVAVDFHVAVHDEEDDSSVLEVYIEQLDGTLMHSGTPVEGLVTHTEPDLPVGEFEYQVRVIDSVGLETTSIQSFTINGLPSAPHVELSRKNHKRPMIFAEWLLVLLIRKVKRFNIDLSGI